MSRKEVLLRRANRTKKQQKKQQQKKMITTGFKTGFKTCDFLETLKRGYFVTKCQQTIKNLALQKRSLQEQEKLTQSKSN